MNSMLLLSRGMYQLRGARIPLRMGQDAQEGFNLIPLITSVLQALCEKEGVTSANCASFTDKLAVCKASLETAVAAGDIIGIGSAVVCLSSLYNAVKAALDYVPPLPPPPPPPPPAASTGFPLLGYIAIGVLGLGTAGAILYAVTR